MPGLQNTKEIYIKPIIRDYQYQFSVQSRERFLYSQIKMMSLYVIFIALLALSETQGSVAGGKCSAKADIVFILDSSGSVGQANYNKQLHFAVDLTKSFNIGVKDVLFGSVVFSFNAIKWFDLKDNIDSASLESALLKSPYLASTTYTDKAIHLVLDSKMFSSTAGGRHDAKKIAIIMTDGKSDMTDQTLEAASQLRASGVVVMCIGIGQASLTELRGMASSEQNVFTADNFDALKAIQKEVEERTCEVNEEKEGESGSLQVLVPGIISKDGQCFLTIHRDRPSLNLYQCQILGLDQLGNSADKTRIDQLTETVKQQQKEINDLKATLASLTLNLNNILKKSRDRLFIESAEYNGKVYLLSRQKNVNARDSMFSCEQEGGHLVEIDDPGENAFLVNFLQSQNTGALIAGTDEGQEGRWYRQRGRLPLPYTNWYPGGTYPARPSVDTNKNCMFLSKNYNWNWVDDSCNYNALPYLCEVPKF